MGRFVAALCGALMVFVVVAVASGVFLFYRYARELPDIEQLTTYEPPVTSRVYAGNGRLMAEYAAEKRVFVPVGSIPPVVTAAFISAEDKNFYHHPGIDTQGVVRAAFTNVSNLGSDRRLVGASTIPQQVAKNFLLSSEVTWERKIKEAILAFRMDQALSKDRILELYLNEIYLGAGSYGVAAAALNYFDKSLDELTLGEAATLASLPKAPNNYDPFRQPAAAKIRRDWVIGRMLEDGHITHEQAEQARAEELVTRRRKATELVNAEYFAEDVRRELIRRFGEDALYKGGLVVHASVDPDTQAQAEQALREGLEAFDLRQGWRGPLAHIDVDAAGESSRWMEQLSALVAPPGLGSWRMAVILRAGDGDGRIGFADGTTGRIAAADMRWMRSRVAPKVGDVIPVQPLEKGLFAPRQVPKVEGALVAMDPHTGRVLAVAGGWDYQLSQFNRATQAFRQSGSAFKPVVYLCALEAGYTPSSVVVDSPLSLSQGEGMPRWTPSNYSNRFYGPTTLRVGLEQSRNVMTVRLALQVGMDKIVDCAERLRVFDTMPPLPAYALGAGETTLLRLTAAYGMMVNGGQRIEPTLIDRIQDRYGRIIFRHDERQCLDCGELWLDSQPIPDIPAVGAAVTDAHSAFQVVSMLEGAVLRGTGTRAQIEGRAIGGKTGTSNDARDVWFIGFSPDLVVGVYVGYDDPQSLGDHAAGGTVAAPIFADFMSKALTTMPAVPFRTPPGIRMVRVDARNGQPTGSGNPRMIFEAFKPGTAPPGPEERSRPENTYTRAPDTGTGGLY